MAARSPGHLTSFVCTVVSGRLGCVARRAFHGALLIGMTAGLAACAASGAVPAPFPRPGGAGLPDGRPGRGPAAATLDRATAEAATAAAGPFAGAVVGTALALQGVPYREGGGDASGFDCSGLVAYVFGRHGLWLPRTVGEQFALGRPVDRGAVLPGDLVFFSTVASGASHVGIAVSSREFVHAPSSRGVVRIEPLWAPYWSARYLGARRLRRP